MVPPFSSHFPIRRVLSRVTALVIVAVVMLVPSAVSAQEYPPAPTVVVDQAIVPEGGIVTITGSGFLPDSTIEVYLTSVPGQTSPGTLLGTTTSDASGDFAFR